MPETALPNRYELTALTPLRVARATGYIDWNLQPSAFKHYPSGLFRYALDADPVPVILALARRVTSEASVGGRPYLRLNTPSAGNLHPVELYVQVRGVAGMIGGIYHVDAAEGTLVLLREVDAEGLEASVGLEAKCHGFLFVVSCVPFRSAWKYGERSWRYCHLDAGHQLGALKAAAAADGRDVTFLSEFDGECLDALMGFVGEEFAVGAAFAGELRGRPALPLKSPLMRVQPTDYCETDERVSLPFDREGLDAPLLSPLELQAASLEGLIRSRRSARAFVPGGEGGKNLERLMHIAEQPPQPLNCHTLVLRGEALEPGLYRRGRMVRGGNFTKEITRLLVDQPFVSTSSLVLIVGASAFSAGTLIRAGAFAHILHLHAHALRLGFSPVGAFLDHALRRFLQTDDSMLYVLVAGTISPQSTVS